MRRVSVAALAAALLALSVSSASADPGGTTGAQFLELGIGARAGAMGEANTAWAEDVYGIYFNPAGVARVPRQEVGLLYNSLFEDIDYSFLGYVHPFANGGTLGVTFQYVDLGSVERALASGVRTGGTAGAHDFALGVTYARPVSTIVDLGATAKWIQESLDDRDANAVALDLGLRYRSPVRGLTFGAAITNLGSNLKFYQRSEKLPLSVRLGAGYRSPGGRWGVTSDLVYVRDQEWEAKVGGEVWVVPNMLALRAGYNSNNDVGSGLTTGAGFKFQDVGIDYAWVPYDDFGDQHLISLTYNFGAERRPWGGGLPADDLNVSMRMEQARVEPARAGAPLTIVCLPFQLRTNRPEYAWFGPAFPEMFHKGWRRTGALAASPSTAEFTLEGDYYIQETNEFAVTARLKQNGRVVQTFQWRNGDVERPFLLWDIIVARVNAELLQMGVNVQVTAPRRPM